VEKVAMEEEEGEGEGERDVNNMWKGKS